ncbi:two-component system response regulator [Pseudonocardia sp. CNS-139]|nr:two-component system response regulator [Pseudonocardia sp. CNS-139]
MTAPVRVLVVDDDFAVCAIHRGYLESMPGFAVVGEAHRGLDAVEAVGALAPDLVLLDIHLPDLSGIEVLRRIRAVPGPPVDVVAITAAREVETVRDAMAGGVVHYLVKPFAFSAFRERLELYAANRADLLRRASDAGAELAQSDVDRILQSRQRTLAPQRLPKGLSARTLDLVAATLRAADGADLSAVEVAERCGMARVSARRYLEHLDRTGLAEVRPRYGQAGRPENGYRWVG